MSGTGRRRSPRRAGTPESAPQMEAVAPAIEPEVELLDDRSIPITGARAGRSLGRSLPGAIAGTLLVVGLAFGAALGTGNLGPTNDREGAGSTTAADGVGESSLDTGDGDGARGDDGWGDGPDATAKPGEPDGEHPDATKEPDSEHPDATTKPDGEPTEKPDATPKPTEKPDATKPPLEAIALGLGIKEYHAVVEWGSCSGLDFDAYKVVRSMNSTASWPLGEGDTLIAVVEPGGNRRAYDGESAHGVKVWYRVFCVRHTEDGYKVVNSSAARGIEVPEELAPPPPDPITLGLEASLVDGGKVRLDWSACEVDGFAFYKVVRSTTNEDPSYLPYHDGTDVVGVVSEAGATALEVWPPDGGGTAWYRVQCIGYHGDQKVLLGESAVVAVTVP